MNLLVATGNPGKLAEIADVLKGNSLIEVLPLTSLSTYPEIIEDGRTFEENALKKARTLADFSGYATLADDSGLMVDALDGAPGVHSARYSGPDATETRNNEKLLGALADIPEERRTARFVCVLALCLPSSSGSVHWFFHGECEGRITEMPKGKNGFGYDPVFLYPPLGKTFAELDRKTKSRVSHRGKALEKLVQALPSLLDLQANP
jgi:XTP/dITP diphosphohydrolase